MAVEPFSGLLLNDSWQFGEVKSKNVIQDQGKAI